MPAPVRCEAEVSIQEADGSYKRAQSATVVFLNCETCPVGSRNFIADSRYFDNPKTTAIRNAGEFLATGCGLKKNGEAVILPRGL